MTFEKAQSEFRQGSEDRRAKRFNEAVQHFRVALPLYLQEILHGDGTHLDDSLMNAGMSYWRSRLKNYRKDAQSYFVAMVMNNTSYRGWWQLATTDLVDKSVDPYRSRCYLGWAWRMAHKGGFGEKFTDDITNDANHLDHNFFPRKMELDGLDRLWGIVSSFWIFQYQNYTAITKGQQEGMGDFGKVAAVWCQLHSHFGLSTSPLYLVYVENDFNREIIKVIAWVFGLLGYDTTLIIWNRVADYSFPENAAIAILDDISLLVKPDENNQRNYEKIQQHSGKKFLVPWQVPDDFFVPDYVPAHWKFCERLKTSLRDDPVSLIFRELPRYLYNTSSCEFSDHLNYFESRIAHVAQVLFQNNLDAQMKAIAKLWPKPRAGVQVEIHMQYASHHRERDREHFVYWPFTEICKELKKNRISLSVSLVRRMAGGRKQLHPNRSLFLELKYIQYFCENNGAALVKFPAQDITSLPAFHDRDGKKHAQITLYDDVESVQPIRISMNGELLPLFSMLHFFRAWPPALQKWYHYLNKDFLPKLHQGGPAFQAAQKKWELNDYTGAMVLYRQSILTGDADDFMPSVMAAGMSYWCANAKNYRQNAQAYFKAAVMYNGYDQAWLQLDQTDRDDSCVDYYRSMCYRGWAEKAIDGYVSLTGKQGQVKEVDNLDRMWGIVSPFWIMQYNGHMRDDFSKTAQLWSQLHSQYGFSVRPLCLVYVDNDFNRNIIHVIEAVLGSCGYPTTLVLWNDVVKYSFPDNAVILILDDFFFLVQPDERNKRCYEKIKHHSGEKYLVPWQIPNDFFEQENPPLPGHLQSFKRLCASLRDQPIAVIFGELARYLYDPATERSEHIYYLEKRIAHAAQIMYQDNIDEHMRAISTLWSKPIMLEYASDDTAKDALLPSLPRSHFFGRADNSLAVKVVPRVSENRVQKIFPFHGIRHELDCIRRFIENNALSLVELPEANQDIFSSNGFYDSHKQTCAWPYISNDVNAIDNPVQYLKVLVDGKFVELFPIISFLSACPPALQDFYSKFNKHFGNLVEKLDCPKSITTATDSRINPFWTKPEVIWYWEPRPYLEPILSHPVSELHESKSNEVNATNNTQSIVPKFATSVSVSFTLACVAGLGLALVFAAHCASLVWASSLLLMSFGLVTLGLLLLTGVFYSASEGVRPESSSGFFNTVTLGTLDMFPCL